MPTKPESSTFVELSQEELHAYIDDRMRQVVRILFEHVLEEELTAVLQAEPYERNGLRLGQRNGSYTRDLVTRFGRIVDLRVPRERAGRFRTKLFDRYKRRVKEIDTAIRDMFINGISTRKVGAVTELLLETAPSASTVSRVFHTLEAECEAWRERPLDAHYLYIFLDGTNFTIGYDDEFDKHPLLAALGVKLNGERELLGYAPGNKESRAAWETFLEDLKRRGVERADLWITDGGQAVIGAVDAKFAGASRQRCVLHKVENILSYVSKSKQREIRRELDRVFYTADSEEAARREAEAFRIKWEPVFPAAVACLQRDLDDCLRFYRFPKKHWRSIRTNNYLERLFGEVKKRTHSMGAFRNEKSCILVFYAVIRSLRFQRFSVSA